MIRLEHYIVKRIERDSHYGCRSETARGRICRRDAYYTFQRIGSHGMPSDMPRRCCRQHATYELSPEEKVRVLALQPSESLVQGVLRP